MAYTTIDNPELYFQTKLYTGTGSSHAITLDGDEDMQPDWVWWKERASTDYPTSVDSVRGATKRIFTNATEAQDTNTESLKSFDSDGFTMGTNSGANQSSQTYVAWCWKAGTSFSNDASATGVGVTDSSGSINTTAGFSIITYAGNDTVNNQIAHGLGVKPDWIIFKQTSSTGRWHSYHSVLGATKHMRLDQPVKENTASSFMNNVEPTSSIFNLGTSAHVNDGTIIAYCFAQKKGFSKFGKYVGNGNADGVFVYTGFKPAWLMVKNATHSSGSKHWGVHDSKRDTHNPSLLQIDVEDNYAEFSSTNRAIDFLSNGFKIRSSDSDHNTQGDTYIYFAFAEAPFVNSKKIPTNAR